MQLSLAFYFLVVFLYIQRLYNYYLHFQYYFVFVYHTDYKTYHLVSFLSLLQMKFLHSSSFVVIRVIVSSSNAGGGVGGGVRGQ